MPAGCVLGSINLVDVRKMTKEDEYEGGAFCEYIPGAYAWVMETTGKQYRPDKVIGKLKFFDVPDEKLVQLAAGDRFYNYPPAQGEVKFTKRCNIV
jgi:hypothetical protein